MDFVSSHSCNQTSEFQYTIFLKGQFYGFIKAFNMLKILKVINKHLEKMKYVVVPSLFLTI